MIKCVLLNQGNGKDPVFPRWANSGSTLFATRGRLSCPSQPLESMSGQRAVGSITVA